MLSLIYLVYLNTVLFPDSMFSFKSAIFILHFFLSNGIPTRSAENLLDQIKLDNYPLAKCNDGSTAVYYRKPLNSEQDTKKILIYLKGGGFCVPFVPGNFITSLPTN